MVSTAHALPIHCPGTPGRSLIATPTQSHNRSVLLATVPQAETLVLALPSMRPESGCVSRDTLKHTQAHDS